MSLKDFVKEKTKKLTNSEGFKEMMSTVLDDEYYGIKKEILTEIEESDSIIIVRHKRPDGDCIGSSLGLRAILRNSFPNKKIYSVGDGVPSYLNFLGEEDIVEEEIYENSLVIVVDTATEQRIESDKYTNAKRIIKIDHHIPVESYGHINYVREDYPACCQIITDLVNTFKSKLKINSEAALCLYTGLVTDSGRFRYRNVDGETMRCAGSLLDIKIDTERMYTHLNTKSAESFKLQGYIYQNFELTDNGVAYAFISKKLMKKFNASVEDASNLVNCLDSIRGSLIWILFVEYDDEIRVRLRSRYIPVVDIANQFNGGGHENACGATLQNEKQIKELLSVADSNLKKFKENNKELF